MRFMFFVMSYFVVGQAYNTTLIVGTFRSGGDTQFGLILDMSTMWGCSCLLYTSCHTYIDQIPMALQNLINVGVTAADVVMLGKVGEHALSGASLAGQVQYIMTCLLYTS